ncbi:hypothetical protein BH11PSE1_BH11PSE1_26180 [soil metagenome]|uniref:Uncharacterized protein n=1 Tax=Phenylobacterium glaciei TaxID=2803784 RepID=A0A941D0F6_9CAUL|nr:hypothetical protein [Phenylobacterium glaciei]MBR7618613.1 hypothetical protein [Phenylobacterium glaciei]QQZ50995.1 hypothetical protein JKL49_07265 [Phenylobacterium glaciei]
MTLPVTLALIAAFLALAIFSGWRGAQPPNPLKGVRMAPHRLIMVTAAAGVLILLVHLVNLLGVVTGR